MALTNAALEVMGDALAGAITHVSLHSADPGGTGANEVGTRLATSWDLTDPDGDTPTGRSPSPASRHRVRSPTSGSGRRSPPGPSTGPTR